MLKQTFLVHSARIDERQPFLAISRNDSTAEEGGVPPKPRRQNWRKTYRIVLWLLCATVPATFIKRIIADIHFNLGKTLKAALWGGLTGAIAMFFSVLTLMPLRTVMTYQYRYGATTSEVIRTLYTDGGWTRFYHGLTIALFQAFIIRFGDTAANAGILVLFESTIYFKDLPVLVKTIFASIAAAAFRLIFTPVDTVKTVMQTQGRKGLPILQQKIKQYGIRTLWSGAIAIAVSGLVGHYLRFGTYNYLEANLPEAHTLFKKLLRLASIGFIASVLSDSVCNSLKVVRVYCQVSEAHIEYFDAARAVIATDGVKGLLGRGLKTRLLINGIQGLMFSILWKFFQDMYL
ncbi:hypothetical protein H2248_011086 [Termitomyces sp. 'cryptogamus']|nr:hypothetical protein H2248_011086 [Termitomyces sp. 'cryptogamus']